MRTAELLHPDSEDSLDPGRREDRAWFPACDELAAAQERDAIRALRGLIQIMQDDEYADSLRGERSGEPQDYLLLRQILARGRLVEQQVSLGLRVRGMELG